MSEPTPTRTSREGSTNAGILILVFALAGPMLLAAFVGHAGTRDNDIGKGMLQGSLPIAAVGCGLCVDFAQRCFFEDPIDTTRPRGVSVLCGMLWTVMAWICAFALGRVL